MAFRALHDQSDNKSGATKLDLTLCAWSVFDRSQRLTEDGQGRPQTTGAGRAARGVEVVSD